MKKVINSDSLLSEAIGELHAEEEIWKDIPNANGQYQASNLGRIKSLPKWRNIGHRRFFQLERVIGNRRPNKRGYYRLGFKIAGETLIHRIVALTFLQKDDDRDIINHIDSNPSNNRINNLEWCTQRENVIHSYKNGRTTAPKCLSGSKHKNSKLLESDIPLIKSRYEETKNYCIVAKEFAVSEGCIRKIILGDTWKQVK